MNLLLIVQQMSVRTISVGFFFFFNVLHCEIFSVCLIPCLYLLPHCRPFGYKKGTANFV